MTTAAATFDPEVDEHIGAGREIETGGIRGRNLWAAVFFAAGFLAIAVTALGVGSVLAGRRSFSGAVDEVTSIPTAALRPRAPVGATPCPSTRPW